MCRDDTLWQSVLFTDASAKTQKYLGQVSAFPMTKVYAWYDDAWWSSKLGYMEGYFGVGGNASGNSSHHYRHAGLLQPQTRRSDCS